MLARTLQRNIYREACPPPEPALETLLVHALKGCSSLSAWMSCPPLDRKLLANFVLDRLRRYITYVRYVRNQT